MMAVHFEKMWWAYAVIFVMVCLSACFSGAEISFNTANKMRLRRAAEEGSKTAKLAHSIADNFTTSLSTILVGNNISLVIYSLYMSLMLHLVFKMIGWESLATSGSVLLETANAENIPLPLPVHRLDRETAGVMVYAKTSVAAASLSKQIERAAKFQGCT